MIVLGYIEIHHNGCIIKISVKGLMVLLILYFKIWRIFVKTELDVYVWSVKTKASLWWCIFFKGFVEKYLCWFAHGEPYVPYETMLERIIGSTSSSNNTHEVVDDNSNRYRSMVIDAMRINHVIIVVVVLMSCCWINYECPCCCCVIRFDRGYIQCIRKWISINLLTESPTTIKN